MASRIVLSIVGNRPQYIKAAIVSRAVRGVAGEVLLDTGQHYDHELAGVFFDELDLPRPDIELGVGSDGHARQTAAMLTGIAAAIEERGSAGSCSSTATRTRPSPARWPRPSCTCRSPTSRLVCARSTGACPKSSTAC